MALLTQLATWRSDSYHPREELGQGTPVARDLSPYGDLLNQARNSTASLLFGVL